MSIMICNNCKTIYGPTMFVCPSCGSTNVDRAEVKQAADEGSGTPHRRKTGVNPKATPELKSLGESDNE